MVKETISNKFYRRKVMEEIQKLDSDYILKEDDYSENGFDIYIKQKGKFINKKVLIITVDCHYGKVHCHSGDYIDEARRIAETIEEIAQGHKKKKEVELVRED